jgi:chemotaxis protein methyltransferase CheR
MPPPVWETGSEQVAYLGAMARRIGGFELEKERSLLSDPRVMDLLFREKAGTLEELVERLRVMPEGPLHHTVVESLAVADTSFFRDCRIFEKVEKTLIPCLIENKENHRRLTLWSAGCSTGQETYSLAIAANEALEDCVGWSWKIIGTDLSARNIRAAEAGIYSQFDINCGLPARRLVDYFKKVNGHWCVQESLKKHIVFHKLNLAADDSVYPQVDLILLRNVLKYFEPTRKNTILAKMRAALRPDGYLVLGEGEVANRENGFEPVHSGNTSIFRTLNSSPQTPHEFPL